MSIFYIHSVLVMNELGKKYLDYRGGKADLKEKKEKSSMSFSWYLEGILGVDKNLMECERGTFSFFLEKFFGKGSNVEKILLDSYSEMNGYYGSDNRVDKEISLYEFISILDKIKHLCRVGENKYNQELKSLYYAMGIVKNYVLGKINNEQVSGEVKDTSNHGVYSLEDFSLASDIYYVISPEQIRERSRRDTFDNFVIGFFGENSTIREILNDVYSKMDGFYSSDNKVDKEISLYEFAVILDEISKRGKAVEAKDLVDLPDGVTAEFKEENKVDKTIKGKEQEVTIVVSKEGSKPVEITVKVTIDEEGRDMILAENGRKEVGDTNDVMEEDLYSEVKVKEKADVPEGYKTKDSNVMEVLSYAKSTVANHLFGSTKPKTYQYSTLMINYSYANFGFYDSQLYQDFLNFQGISKGECTVTVGNFSKSFRSWMDAHGDFINEIKKEHKLYDSSVYKYFQGFVRTISRRYDDISDKLNERGSIDSFFEKFSVEGGFKEKFLVLFGKSESKQNLDYMSLDGFIALVGDILRYAIKNGDDESDVELFNTIIGKVNRYLFWSNKS